MEDEAVTLQALLNSMSIEAVEVASHKTEDVLQSSTVYKRSYHPFDLAYGKPSDEVGEHNSMLSCTFAGGSRARSRSLFLSQCSL